MYQIAFHCWFCHVTRHCKINSTKSGFWVPQFLSTCLGHTPVPHSQTHFLFLLFSVSLLQDGRAPHVVWLFCFLAPWLSWWPCDFWEELRPSSRWGARGGPLPCSLSPPRLHAGGKAAQEKLLLCFKYTDWLIHFICVGFKTTFFKAEVWRRDVEYLHTDLMWKPFLLIILREATVMKYFILLAQLGQRSQASH